MSLINIIIQQNSEISAYSTKHPREIGEELKRMVEKGWLVSEGKGRGMRYRLKNQTLGRGGQAGGQAVFNKSIQPEILLPEWPILSILKEGELSSSELKRRLDSGKDKSLSGAFKEKLASLREKGLIEYTIPEKPKSPLQKYRLTKLGLEKLKGK